MEPEVKKEHKYISVLITVLVMLFVVTLVGGGVWYYINKKNNKTEPNIKQVAEEPWINYTNPVYKYSLSYPPYAKLTENDEAFPAENIAISDEKGFTFFILFVNKSDKTATDWIKSYYNYPTDIRAAKVAGLDGYTFNTVNSVDYLVRDSKGNYINAFSNKYNVETFQKVLETLRIE